MSVQSGYSITQIDEAFRKTLNPYQFSSYLTSPETGLALTGSTDNKVSLPVSLVPGINGFDIYTTPQGTALRFIGSGLGNGDVATLRIEVSSSIEATSGAADVLFKAKTRPYTETAFTNAVDITGLFVSEDIANNSEATITIVAPLISVSDGDLIEIAINPASGVTISINTFASKIIEL